MSGTDGSKTLTGWTEKEKLTYLFALIDNSNVKFDFNNTPRPAGRSVIACQRMLERLKGTLKTELEALKSGDPINDTAAGTPKKTPTPRKRKAKGDADGEIATPTKRGRKKKVVEEKEEEEVLEEDEDTIAVKPEPKEEGG